MGYTYYVGQFEEGKTYNVVFDGTTYPCVWKFPQPGYYSEAHMGNGSIMRPDQLEDTGEPFVFHAFSYYGFPIYSIVFKENGAHTVGIEGYFEPTSFPSTITDGLHGFGPALVSGNTYKIKWNGVEYNLTAFTINDSQEVYLGNHSLINYDLPSSEGNEPFCFVYIPFYGMLNICTSEKQENTFSIEGILPEQTRKFNIELSYQYMTDIDVAWQLGLEENKEYTVILDGEEYNCICKYNYEFETLYIGSEKLFYPLRTIDDYPFVITTEGFCTIKGVHNISIREDLAVKIDKKFLPPLVGKKTYVAEGAEIFNDYSYNIASGNFSHAEGVSTRASGDYSHAEGNYTAASGECSHAEGVGTAASGDCSHAEGNNTRASGTFSHAEGSYTAASGKFSHAEGKNTKASSDYQHVQGQYNIEDTEDKYAHIVGNGDYNKSSNNHTLDWEGNAWYQGDVYVGSTSGTNRDDGSKKLATEEYVDNAVQEIYKQPEEPTDAPEGALWVDTDEESGSGGSGGGVSSWNDLTDKPFEEIVTISDTLTWDGNTSGLVSLGPWPHFKVSDNVPTAEDLANGYEITLSSGATVTSTDYPLSTNEEGDIYLGNGAGPGIPLVVIVQNDTMSIPTQKGIYFIAINPQVESLTIPGYTFENKVIKTIEPKYMPKHLQLKESIVETDTLTWDGNIQGLGMLPNAPLYKVSDSVPTAEDLANGYEITLKGSDIPITNEEHPLTTNEEGEIYLGDGAFPGIPIVLIVPNDETSFGQKGIYFVCWPPFIVESLKIPGYTFEIKETKLDKKYIPDTMPEVTIEDNGKILRVVDGVWAAASIPTAEEVGALTEAQVTTMINNALGVIENGAY